MTKEQVSKIVEYVGIGSNIEVFTKASFAFQPLFNKGETIELIFKEFRKEIGLIECAITTDKTTDKIFFDIEDISVFGIFDKKNQKYKTISIGEDNKLQVEE